MRCSVRGREPIGGTREDEPFELARLVSTPTIPTVGQQSSATKSTTDAPVATAAQPTAAATIGLRLQRWTTSEVGREARTGRAGGNSRSGLAQGADSPIRGGIDETPPATGAAHADAPAAGDAPAASAAATQRVSLGELHAGLANGRAVPRLPRIVVDGSDGRRLAALRSEPIHTGATHGRGTAAASGVPHYHEHATDARPPDTRRPVATTAQTPTFGQSIVEK